MGKPAGEVNNAVSGAASIASVRLLAGYDRVLHEGLAVGLRFGVSFLGSPGVGNAEERYDECVAANGKAMCRSPQANDFAPIHAELRASYFLIDSTVERARMAGKLFTPRPYIFVGGGLAQVNASETISVCDTVDANGSALFNAASDRCPANTKKRKAIKAYQVTGRGFVNIGVGGIFPLHDNLGVNLELKMMFMAPTFGFVFAPSVAPVVMF